MKITVDGQMSLEQAGGNGFAKVQVTFGEFSHVLAHEDGSKTLMFDLGKKEDLAKRNWIKLVRKMVNVAKTNKIKKLALDIKDINIDSLGMSEAEALELLIVNAEMANYEFRKYLKQPEKGWEEVEEILVVGTSEGAEKTIERATHIAEEVNACRDLANTPGGDINPEKLADYVVNHLTPLGVKVEVFDYEKIKELKMGGVIAVGKGSIEKPRFIIMEHMKGEEGEKPLILVGKGITFDTGGLNLKPGNSMTDMYLDMSGSAAVIHTMALVAKLGVKKNVIALVPSAENMISQESFRPGDIITMMSGKTVEVHNTDAEGRLILADALHYAKQYDPRLVVEVSTLTGSACIAVGDDCCATFTRDLDLSVRTQELGRDVGDYVWPLPIWKDMQPYMKGTYADLKNISGTRYGSASHAGIFLHEFVDYKFIHIDMAPHMRTNKYENLQDGASGSPVRLMIRMVEEM